MGKTCIEVEVFADIPSTIWILERDEEARRLAEQAIADLSSLAGHVALQLWNGNKYPIKIEAFDTSSDFEHFENIRDKEGTGIKFPRTFIRLSSNVCYTAADIDQVIQSEPGQDAIGDIPVDERIKVFSESACSELHSTLLDLYLALSIAHPGSIYFWESWLFCERRFLRTEHGAMTSFDEARKRTIELKWPKIQNLNVADVYQWLTNVPGFHDRRGIGPIGRAIAALSYLIKTSSKSQELSLVWALLGLEALYGRGNVGLKAQLLEKSEALLGPRQENKKVFSWMYDFRSRLLHGDMDLLYQHNHYDADPIYETLWDEFYECEAVATAMLIATLQDLCKRRSYSLEFGYRLK